jgi:hypothetical protein
MPHCVASEGPAQQHEGGGHHRRGIQLGPLPRDRGAVGGADQPRQVDHQVCPADLAPARLLSRVPQGGVLERLPHDDLRGPPAGQRQGGLALQHPHPGAWRPRMTARGTEWSLQPYSACGSAATRHRRATSATGSTRARSRAKTSKAFCSRFSKWREAVRRRSIPSCTPPILKVACITAMPPAKATGCPAPRLHHSCTLVTRTPSSPHHWR